MGPNKGILQGWLVIYLLSAGTVSTAGMGLYGLSWLVSSARRIVLPRLSQKGRRLAARGQPQGMHWQGRARALGHEPRAQESPSGDVMSNASQDTHRALCDCATVLPFAAVVPLAGLLLGVWIVGDYVFGPLFRAIGL